ncbi:hypothetical protein [Fischerella sp. PCC 9605]|uniref:hypothetical protein n=1 Tax=Fischerella sp. PCC 9605 TaxID=1173024 RepID=UPI0012DC6FB3|nr:hypothetical protein [Fischerella sp. PCC 9605]
MSYFVASMFQLRSPWKIKCLKPMQDKTLEKISPLNTSQIFKLYGLVCPLCQRRYIYPVYTHIIVLLAKVRSDRFYIDSGCKLCNLQVYLHLDMFKYQFGQISPSVN